MMAMLYDPAIYDALMLVHEMRHEYMTIVARSPLARHRAWRNRWRFMRRFR